MDLPHYVGPLLLLITKRNLHSFYFLILKHEGYARMLILS